MSRAIKPKISFIVLNWNGLNDTKKCLESIRNISYPDKEIIVVDNGSTDGSKKYFRNIRDIKFVDLATNMGFAGGHIKGKEAASGAYLAIINNDLVLGRQWANKCMETFKRHADAAIVGGKAYKWDADNKPYNNKNDYFAYQEVDPGSAHTRTLLVAESETCVDSISGAALLVKKHCLRRVGYFDKDFFAYYEETDLIARLIRNGYRAYFNPEAHAWHKIGASTGFESDFYLYMMHRNRFLFAAKNFDEKNFLRFKRLYKRAALFALISLFLHTNSHENKMRIRAYRWIMRNKKLWLKKRVKSLHRTKGSYIEKLRACAHTDVTIIIPCYNYGQYVAEAIESALAQTIAPKEIIVINDGSTDNSRSVINQYKHNSKIKIVHKKNAGVIATKNLGITLSKTYWTVFLDADDTLSRAFLELTLVASSNGKLDLVYTDMRLFGAKNDIFKAREYQVHTLLKGNYINNSALIKTSLLKEVGGYKSDMKHGLEDWELYVSLAEARMRALYLPYPLVNYRQHKGAMSRNMHTIEREKELYQQIRGLHKGFYRRNNYALVMMRKFFELILYSIRYPTVPLVVLYMLPRALKQFSSFLYREAVSHARKKIGIQ